MPETRRCVCSDSKPPFTDWRLVYLAAPRCTLICDVHPCLCRAHRCGRPFRPITAPSVSAFAASLPSSSCVSAPSFPMCHASIAFPVALHILLVPCASIPPYLASNLSLAIRLCSLAMRPSLTVYRRVHLRWRDVSPLSCVDVPSLCRRLPPRACVPPSPVRA